MEHYLTHILVVEDDELSRIGLSSILSDYAQVDQAMSFDHALELLSRNEYQMAFFDLDLERELLGLELVPKALEKDIYTIVLSGREEDETIEQAYSKGCQDYLCKPFHKKDLEYILKKFKIQRKDELFQDFFQKIFLTQDHDFMEELAIIKDAAVSDRPILLTGETGTGKTMVAKLIHKLQFSACEKFLHLNCSELPDSLLESELFGFQKGAFSGAVKNKVGLLKLADGGTLFLDEIATMPLLLQKKLLKVIEDGAFFPLGGVKEVSTRFRLISATCDDLKNLVANKEFREDLYYRIEGFNISLRPLRKRRGDISLLIQRFLKKGIRRVVLKQEVLEVLKRYNWPGNVRQLQKLIEIFRAKNRGIITLKDLPQYYLENIPPIQVAPHSPYEKMGKFVKDGIFLKKDQFDYIRKQGLREFFDRIEEDAISYFLQENDNKVRQTLHLLKTSNTFFYKVLERMKKREKGLHGEK